MSDVVVKTRNELATPVANEITRERKETWKRTYCKGATDFEAEVFINTCIRTGLSPEKRHIFAIKRWDSREKREVLTPQVSIDGLRLIAQRTGVYGGQIGPLWCGEDKHWTDIWLEKKPPLGAKIAVLRKDWSEPLWASATWSSYCQYNGKGEPTPLWQKMPEVMLAKCAESLALRKAFPDEMGGLYTAEEMAQATPVQKQDKWTRLESLMLAFADYGVTRYMLEDHCQGLDIEEFGEVEFDKCRKLLIALRSGQVKPADLGVVAEPAKGNINELFQAGTSDAVVVDAETDADKTDL